MPSEPLLARIRDGMDDVCQCGHIRVDSDDVRSVLAELDATRAALQRCEQELRTQRFFDLSTQVELLTGERDALATELRQVRDRLVEVEMERDAHLATERDAARAEAAKLREALAPFAHPDLCKATPAIPNDGSAVYGRNFAVLLLGDFRRAQAALTPSPHTEEIP